MIEGFGPVYDENSEVLILGSFPSVKSRAEGFYYGNRRNRFWNLLREYSGFDFGDDIRSKREFLLSRGIALWDVVASCEIVGSADADIKSPTPANLKKVIDGSKIRAVICNGKKAFELYSAHFAFPVKVYALPSTSPANVSFDKSAWFAAFDELNLKGGSSRLTN